MTRRLVAILVLVLGLAGGATAQTAFGLKAGASSAGLTGGEAGSATSRYMFVGGVFYGVGLTDHLAGQIEVLYTRKGAAGFRSDADTIPGGAAATLTMDYLEVPVLLRAGFPTESMLFSVYAGPVLSMRMACKVDPEDGSDGAECGEDGAIQGFHPRATDLGATAGLGIDLALGESTFFIDGRYTLGLLSIEAGDDGLDAAHALMTVMAGFAFPLGR